MNILYYEYSFTMNIHYTINVHFINILYTFYYPFTLYPLHLLCLSPFITLLYSLLPYFSSLFLSFLMAPIYVKGGTWTHVEDEILKAAISKYGLTQWARVLSLLPKKLAKQAKARWFEYLLPRTQGKSQVWTRDDDDKLLGLVKIFPNQWRSIAPIVGRTAAECVERYQKLIDEAGGIAPDTNNDDLGLSGAGIETLPATGPTAGAHFVPETQESIPAEDMEDDDREMIAEAKARLANTLGKKAKRKARERMLDELKRIALLQKRREMKSAGINVRLTKLKKGEFDHINDIVNEHEPVAGLHDVLEENVVADRELESLKRKIGSEGMDVTQRKKKTPAKVPQDNTEKATEQKVADLELLQPQPTKKEDSKTGRGKSFISDLLSRLPPPKHTRAVVIPALEEQVDEIALGEEPDELILVDHGEHLRNLEILRQVSDEQAKMRRSQVVQRDMEIPKPWKLPKQECTGIAARVQQELLALVGSDYRRYVDNNTEYSLVEDLDEEVWNKVWKEVKEEMERGKRKVEGEGNEGTTNDKEENLTSKEQPDTNNNVSLDSKIDKLTSIYNTGSLIRERIDTAVGFDEFIEKEQALIASIQELHAESVALEQEIEMEQALAAADAVVFAKRRDHWRSMVDRVNEMRRGGVYG